jgi:hypothetical protein
MHEFTIKKARLRQARERFVLLSEPITIQRLHDETCPPKRKWKEQE